MKTQTKVLQRIPSHIIDTYKIDEKDGHIVIHNPAFVNIDFDDRFGIIIGNTTVDIRNSKVYVSLWKEIIHLHISVL